MRYFWIVTLEICISLGTMGKHFYLCTNRYVCPMCPLIVPTNSIFRSTATAQIAKVELYTMYMLRIANKNGINTHLHFYNSEVTKLTHVRVQM